MFIGFIVIPRMSDFYGRRLFVFLGALGTVISMSLALFLNSVTALKGAIFLTTFCIGGRVIIGFSYMQDFLTKEAVAYAVPTVFFIEGTVTALAAVYF